MSHNVGYAIVLGILFGVFNKLADLTNEHGFIFFRGSSTLFGLLWGLSGSLLVILNEYLAIVLLSLTLFWLTELKLDYRNHATAGAMIILASIWKIHHLSMFNWGLFLTTFGLYMATGWIHRNLKEIPAWRRFLRLHLRYYAIPLFVSVWINDLTPFIVIAVDMFAVELVTIRSNRLKPGV